MQNLYQKRFCSFAKSVS